MPTSDSAERRREAPDRNLAMELVRVTEAAAMAAGRWVGRGDKNGGDGAAVDAMRQLIGSVSMRGVVVIGEGEKDEAPMLFNGEEVGNGEGAWCDVAVDPIDGTTLMAKGMPGSVAVLAVSERGAMFDPSAVFYMEKLAVGPEAADAIDITTSVAENIRSVAAAKGTDVHDVTVCVLDRPRHADLVKDIRRTGARIHFISDGDVAGAISAARPNTGIDLLYGIGGTPEGIITAAAMKCMGGAMQGRLWPRDDAERQKALDAGHDLDRVLTRRRPRPQRQRVLLRHRHHRRRPAARGALPGGRVHDAVDRDAVQVRHGPDDRGLPPAHEAARVLVRRLRPDRRAARGGAHPAPPVGRESRPKGCIALVRPLTDDRSVHCGRSGGIMRGSLFLGVVLVVAATGLLGAGGHGGW